MVATEVKPPAPSTPEAPQATAAVAAEPKITSIDAEDSKTVAKGIKNPNLARRALEMITGLGSRKVIHKEQQNIKDAAAKGVLSTAEAQTKLKGLEEKAKLITEVVGEARKKLSEMKNSSDPEEKAMGFDYEIHGAREQMLADSQEVMKLIAARDLAGVSDADKKEYNKMIEASKKKQEADASNLKALTDERKEIKKDGNVVPDQVVALTTLVAGEELTPEQAARPLDTLETVLVDAGTTPKSRDNLLNRLIMQGVLNKDQAKEFDRLLSLTKEAHEFLNLLRKTGFGMLGLLLFYFYNASKEGLSGGGQQGH